MKFVTTSTLFSFPDINCINNFVSHCTQIQQLLRIATIYQSCRTRLISDGQRSEITSRYLGHQAVLAYLRSESSSNRYIDFAHALSAISGGPLLSLLYFAAIFQILTICLIILFAFVQKTIISKVAKECHYCHRLCPREPTKLLTAMCCNKDEGTCQVILQRCATLTGICLIEHRFALQHQSGSIDYRLHIFFSIDNLHGLLQW